MAVVVPVELDQLAAARVGAGDADGTHRRLGAGVHEAQHLDRRHGARDEFGELQFAFRRGAETGATRRCALDRLDHCGMRVAQHERPPRADEVEVFVAVYVPDASATAAVDEGRGPSDRSERADRAVYTAGDEPASAGEESFRVIEPHQSIAILTRRASGSLRVERYSV